MRRFVVFDGLDAGDDVHTVDHIVDHFIFLAGLEFLHGRIEVAVDHDAAIRGQAELLVLEQLPGLQRAVRVIHGIDRAGIHAAALLNLARHELVRAGIS